MQPVLSTYGPFTCLSTIATHLPAATTSGNSTHSATHVHYYTPKSPAGASPPLARSPINTGYKARHIEIPPVDDWTPDVDYHDTTKVNGMDFPMTVRSSRFADLRDITGMDPLQVPLWKLFYQGLHNTWLRKLAHGREVYILPFDSIGMTVFVAELSNQLKSRNIDVDRLSSFRSRQAGTNLPTKEATQALAKDVAQHIQSLLPTYNVPDASSQQRILELEAELAKVQRQQGSPNDPTASTPPSASTPIQAALHGKPAAPPNFDPSSLLVIPGTPMDLLLNTPPDTLTDTSYKKWIKSLSLTQVQSETLTKNIEKTLKWWKDQPDTALSTIQRVLVAMGMDPTKIKPGTVHEVILKVMTAAMTCAS